MTEQSFLGSGWAFPFDLKDGAVAEADLEAAVRQSILIILSTARGERVMRPDFGCGIYDLLFEANTPATAARISNAVRESLLFLEPRIDVLDVRVTPAEDLRKLRIDIVSPAEAGTVLLIDIDYEVRATDNIFNLVYPFYLERSAG
jgi:phage baseplate assembly protein W